MNEEQFRKLKREVEEARGEADRAQGALDQVRKSLKDDFECEDIQSARKKLTDLEDKKAAAEAAFEKAQAAYIKKWKTE